MRKSAKSEGRPFWKLFKWNWFKPASKILLLTVTRRYFFGGLFALFLYWVCHAFASADCCLVVTCWESSDLLSIVFGVELCVCYFPIWYPGSGVVLNCIDYWSLPPFLLSYCMHSTTYIGCSGPNTRPRLHTNWLHLDPRLQVQCPWLLKFCVQLQNGLQLRKK